MLWCNLVTKATIWCLAVKELINATNFGHYLQATLLMLTNNFRHYSEKFQTFWQILKFSTLYMKLWQTICLFITITELIFLNNPEWHVISDLLHILLNFKFKIMIFNFCMIRNIYCIKQRNQKPGLGGVTT